MTSRQIRHQMDRLLYEFLIALAVIWFVTHRVRPSVSLRR
jgi:hypothetical protein